MRPRAVKGGFAQPAAAHAIRSEKLPMKSPFAVFRKHARVMLVLLTGLAMFAFIFLDQLQPQHFPAVMALLLGAGLFWFIGRKSDKAIEFAVAGAIVGLAVGIAVPRIMGGTNAAVQTSIGNISDRELGNLVQRRQIANSFVAEAYYRANETQFRPPPQFGFRNIQTQEDLERDVVLGYLLRHEADRMGIVVSDKAVTDHIKQITAGELSVADFKEIRDIMRLSEGELYDILRDELKAQQAMLLSTPRKFLSPEEYWELYRRLNVRQKLDVIALPVERFADQAAEPSESELRAFFEQYKNYFANQLDLGAPGFRQPRKLRLAYFEADYDTFQEQVLPVSDEEVQEFYSNNKELYRTQPFPEGGDASNPLDPQFAPEKGPALQGPDTQPGGKTDQPAEQGETEPPADSTKETLPPAESEPSDKKPLEQNKPDTQSDDKNSDGEPAKPAESAGQNDEPSADELTSDDEPRAFNDAPFDEPASAALPDSRGRFEVRSGMRTVGPPNGTAGQFWLTSLQQESPATDDEPGEKPQTLKEEAQPADDDPPAEPATRTDADASPAETKADEADAESPPTTRQTPAIEKPPSTDMPEYRPLDEDLKADIREQLHRERALELMDKVIGDAVSFMYDLGREYNRAQAVLGDEQAQPSLTPQQISDQMVDYAGEHSLRYVSTELLSLQELSESEEHPIVSATEPVDDPSQRQNARQVIEVLAQSQSEVLYVPFRAEDQFVGNQYAYWIIENVDAHIPSFDELGIREQVHAAWRIQTARPEANQRAEELAELLSQSESSLEEALAGQTVTGQEDGEQVVVRETESFSWLRQSTAPPTDIFTRQPPVLSEISAVDRAGPEFMRTVFEKLDSGEIGVAPNVERSVYYVVRVKDRSHSTPEDLEALRQSFMQEDLFFFFSPYAQLANQQQMEANFRYSQRLEQKYAVQFAVRDAATLR